MGGGVGEGGVWWGLRGRIPFPFLSAIVPKGFWWFSRKKDPWKKWGSYSYFLLAES